MCGAEVKKGYDLPDVTICYKCGYRKRKKQKVKDSAPRKYGGINEEGFV
jgi:C4-type Zn-finger protein